MCLREDGFSGIGCTLEKKARGCVCHVHFLGALVFANTMFTKTATAHLAALQYRATISFLWDTATCASNHLELTVSVPSANFQMYQVRTTERASVP